MPRACRHRWWTWIAAPVVVLFGSDILLAGPSLPSGGEETLVMPLKIMSASFLNKDEIPSRHTCDGPNSSPPLEWIGVPEGTKSLALIVDDPDAPDPDAPRMTWVHWVLYNIPPESNGLPEGAETEGLPRGTMQGMNDWHRVGYQGPCPPKGRHRYFFKLYALDKALAGLVRPTKSSLEKAMRGHVIGQAELIGLYQHGR
jgi:Raf kinase inhibitor-like YbhB/YbcL family protein